MKINLKDIFNACRNLRLKRLNKGVNMLAQNIEQELIETMDKDPFAVSYIANTNITNVSQYIKNYHRDEYRKTLIKTVGFTELHRFCSKNNLCIEIKPIDKDRNNCLKISIDKPYGESTDAEFFNHTKLQINSYRV